MKKVDLNKLKTLREKNNFTQKHVAIALGYKSVLGYHYLEKGRCQIKAHQIPILAKLFKVQINELYSADEIIVDKMPIGTDSKIINQ